MMSAVVRAISASKDIVILPSKMKEEEHNCKTENLGCELKESADIGKDLPKESSKEREGDTEVKGDDDACFKPDEDQLPVAEQLPSSEQLEKNNKNDECPSNQKQHVPGSIQISVVGESKEAGVQILSLSVLSPGRPDVVLPIPFPSTTSKATLFTLKEGSKYRIKFQFTVSGNTVNGLKYTYMVWKAGVRVNQTKKMVGTFSPSHEPYVFELEEGTTPTGFFARGPFLVRSKFLDEDEKCFLDTTYYFDIRKDWGAREKC